MSCSRTQHGGGRSRTPDLSLRSPTLYHWATALPYTTPWGQNFDVNRTILSLRSFVASFQKISLKSDFIQFFHDFIHVYGPRAGADSPRGTKFRCQQKYLVTLIICRKFKKVSLRFDFILFFFFPWFDNIGPGQGACSPQGTKFWCQQKLLETSVICC